MFFDSCFALEIIEVLKIIRHADNHKTKKRNICTVSCRVYGESVFTENKNEIKVKRGGILFIPAGTEYFQKSADEEVIVIHMKIYGKHFNGMEYFSFGDGDKITDMFERVFLEWSRKQPGYRQICTAMLYSLFADMKVECQDKGGISKIVNSITYMKSNFADSNLSVADIAAKSGISEIYFRKIWAEFYKESPAKYLTGLRIEYAKTLLSETDYTVSETAELSGYSDTKYFSTKFKKITGKTPLQYRHGFK